MPDANFLEVKKLDSQTCNICPMLATLRPIFLSSGRSIDDFVSNHALVMHERPAWCRLILGDVSHFFISLFLYSLFLYLFYFFIFLFFFISLFALDIQLVVRKRVSLLGGLPPPSPDSVPKGEELWKALKRDPVDKQQVESLLESRAPVNFREPGSPQVSHEKKFRKLY